MKKDENFVLNILGIGAIALMLGLNIRHALNNYGITKNELHLEILAQSNSSGGSSGSGSGSDNYGGGSSGSGSGSNNFGGSSNDPGIRIYCRCTDGNIFGGNKQCKTNGDNAVCAQSEQGGNIDCSTYNSNC
jgi:hypothetical protein